MGWGKECLPFVAMVLVQLGYAGLNIFSKAAMNSGMTPYVLVTYRQIFATVAIALFAFLLERKIRPKMTRKVLYQSIFCSFFGATLNVFLYFIGLQHTTPTIACAASNTFPAITYIVGIIVGMEKLKIKGRAGQAKVFGTCICVGGAMVLSFYHGPILQVPQSGVHWKFVEGTTEKSSGHNSSFLGPLLVICCCVSLAFWLMVQTKLSQNYPVPFTNTTLMCFWSIFPSALVSVIVNHKPSDWSLKLPIRLVSVLYAAIVSSAVGFWLMSWVAGKRGPLYVSIFSPLLLVIVAILSWALLDEQLFVGTLLGSILIVAGLYIVLWGKKEEMEESPKATSTTRSEESGPAINAV
ncbi:unnamed protein product [Rhodiola kirilowii]